MNQITNLCLTHDATVSFLVYASSQSNNASSIASFFTASVALAAVSLSLFSCCCWLIRRWRTRQEKRLTVQRWRLFKELCNIHGLQRPEVKLLKRLLKTLQLENPTVIFVQPECFDIQQTNPLFSGETCREIQKIRDRLFARRIEQ